MENNEKDFENDLNTNVSQDSFKSEESNTSSDPFAAADGGYTQATNSGSYVQPPQNQENQGFAIASMVLGIISLVCCCLGNISLIMAIVSIVFGVITLVKKKPGRGMAIAGIICSSISVVIYIALLIIGLAVGASLSPSDIEELEQYLKNF